MSSPRIAAPVVGFNHNLRHAGRVFHVQTEDSGLPRGHFLTHLYIGGNIIASAKGSYLDKLDAPDLPQLVRKAMEEQHKAMVRRLVAGEFTELAARFSPHYEPGVLADGHTGPAAVNVEGAPGPARPASPADAQPPLAAIPPPRPRATAARAPATLDEAFAVAAAELAAQGLPPEVLSLPATRPAANAPAAQAPKGAKAPAAPIPGRNAYLPQPDAIAALSNAFASPPSAPPPLRPPQPAPRPSDSALATMPGAPPFAVEPKAAPAAAPAQPSGEPEPIELTAADAIDPWADDLPVLIELAPADPEPPLLIELDPVSSEPLRPSPPAAAPAQPATRPPGFELPARSRLPSPVSDAAEPLPEFVSPVSDPVMPSLDKVEGPPAAAPAKSAETTSPGRLPGAPLPSVTRLVPSAPGRPLRPPMITPSGPPVLVPRFAPQAARPQPAPPLPGQPKPAARSGEIPVSLVAEGEKPGDGAVPLAPLFAEELISERSLDEVILAFLSSSDSDKTPK